MYVSTLPRLPPHSSSSLFSRSPAPASHFLIALPPSSRYEFVGVKTDKLLIAVDGGDSRRESVCAIRGDAARDEYGSGSIDGCERMEITETAQGTSDDAERERYGCESASDGGEGGGVCCMNWNFDLAFSFSTRFAKRQRARRRLIRCTMRCYFSCVDSSPSKLAKRLAGLLPLFCRYSCCPLACTNASL